MNAPSIDIKDMLEAVSSLGLSIDDNLFVGKEPEKPAKCVTIFDTPGFSPWLGLSGATGYNYPCINIRVRDMNYVDGWNLINGIKDALHGRANETWSGALYTIITCSGDPAFLNWDDNGRCRFVINFNLQRR